jgi:hypothetical protein
MGVRGGPIQVHYARTSADLNHVSGATAKPTVDTNGVAVPKGWHCDTAHILATKTNSATLDVYGQATISSANSWFKLDSIAFNDSNHEAQRVLGITAYKRIATVRTDTNAGNVNTFVAFSEA